MWIEFSHINIKLSFLLIFPVFRRLEDVVKQAYLTNDNHLFKTFRYFSGYIFSFILLLIMNRRNKKSIITNALIKDKDKDKDIETKPTPNNSFIVNEIEELLQKKEKSKKLKSVLFLLLLSALSCWCYMYRLIFEKDQYEFAKQTIGIFLI